MSKPTKRWVLTFAVVIVGGVDAVLAMRDKSPGDGFAVIELFTSEGCSSCPPADALLAKLVKEGQPRVFPLAFHVDYWNTDQWKDVYSDPRFSRRQEGYAKASGTHDVYTPQMIVNGGKGFVGSDEQVARDQINASLKQKPTVNLSLTAKLEDKSLTIDCKVDAPAVGKTLNVALVERGIRRKIAGGENAGRSLAHENVVRAFDTIRLTSPHTTVKLTLPDDAASRECSVIGYVQDDSMRVLGANSVVLSPNH